MDDASGTTGNVVSSPVEVVVVGHFDDRRSRQCPDAEAAACRDRFVVDRVCWVDGREVPMSDMNDSSIRPGRSTIDEIGAILEVAAPGWPVLSTLTVAAGGLPEIEPVFRTRDEYGLTGEAGVWIVRVVASGEPVTYLVVDGTRSDLPDDSRTVASTSSATSPARRAHGRRPGRRW